MKEKVKVEEVTIEGVTYVPKDSLATTVIEVNGDESPWQVGLTYAIRTVTMIQVGRLAKVTERELVLDDASWIADTGRFHDFLKSGSVKEVEPFVLPVIVGRGAIVDATEWKHNLPNTQK